MHTDSLTIYETDLHLYTTARETDDDHPNAGTEDDDDPANAPEPAPPVGEGELRHPVTKATAVVEQRISHFLMGLAIIGTMTGPLLIVLHTMPAAVFGGVFFIVGWGSLESNGILKKMIYLIREKRFIPRDEKLLGVKKKKIALFVACEVIPVAACVAISQTIAAVGMFF